MNSENKMWESLKAGYLRQVEESLSSIGHPRTKEILDDVSSHIDRRFSELNEKQRTWENMQAIITDMGPASDYAELLNAAQFPAKQGITAKQLLWIVLGLVVLSAVMIILPMTVFCKPKPVASEEFRHNLSEKIAKLDIDSATLNDVIKIFGEPSEYIWGNQTFEKTNLPRNYVVIYPDGFRVFISENKIVELRHEGPESGYVWRGKLKVGSSLDEVLEAVGQAKEIIEGKKNWFEDSVLYKDIDGRTGYCYYSRADQDVRFFFKDYKVIALYTTRSDYGEDH